MRTIQANQPGSPNRSTCDVCGIDVASFGQRCPTCKRAILVAKIQARHSEVKARMNNDLEVRIVE